MFVLLILSFVCAVASTSGYGAPANDATNYAAPPQRGHHYYDYSSSESDSSSSEEHRKCKKLGELSAGSHSGHKAKFFALERKGKHYLQISCPNDGKNYALLADKQGHSATANDGADSVPDSILLATGVNIDFVARCSGRKIYGVANNNEKIRMKKVTCVSLNTSPTLPLS